MGRCKKRRCCRRLDTDLTYKPYGRPMSELALTEVLQDEFEAMRLCDLDKLSQIEAAERMQISRGTVQRLLEAGRARLLRALLNQDAFSILNTQEGENYEHLPANCWEFRDRGKGI